MVKPTLQRQLSSIYTGKKSTTVGASSGKENGSSSNETTVYYSDTPRQVFLNGVGNATLGTPRYNKEFETVTIPVYGLPNINLNGQMIVRLGMFGKLKLVSGRTPEQQEIQLATDLWPYIASAPKDVLHHVNHLPMFKDVDLDSVKLDTASCLWALNVPDLFARLGADPVCSQDTQDVLGSTYFNITMDVPHANSPDKLLVKIGNAPESVDSLVELLHARRSENRDVTAWVSMGLTSIIYNNKKKTVRAKIVAKKVQVFDVEGLAGSGSEGVDLEEGEKTAEGKRPATPIPTEEQFAKHARM